MNNAANTATATDFETAFDRFMNELQAMMDESLSPINGERYKVMSCDGKGRKYLRIVANTFGGGRSAYCFVNRQTGEILKPATWKGPAKHARGNIFGENPIAGCGPHGVAYLI